MNHRIGVALAGALFVLCLVVASVAGPVRVWTTPVPGVTSQETGSADSATTVDAGSRTPDRGERTPPIAGETLVMAITLLLVLMAVFAIRDLGLPLTRRSAHLRKPRGNLETWKRLPDVELSTEHVDVIAARRRLRRGRPRNAIIQCWIRVQDDLAAVGFDPWSQKPRPSTSPVWWTKSHASSHPLPNWLRSTPKHGSPTMN